MRFLVFAICLMLAASSFSDGLLLKKKLLLAKVVKAKALGLGALGVGALGVGALALKSGGGYSHGPTTRIIYRTAAPTYSYSSGHNDGWSGGYDGGYSSGGYSSGGYSSGGYSSGGWSGYSAPIVVKRYYTNDW